MKIFASFLLMFFLPLANANSATTDWQKHQGNGAESRLIASFYNDQNNEKQLIVGLQFKINPGWTIYSHDSEGVGFPPNFDFSKSKNYSSYEVFWPKAMARQEKIGKESIKYSVYDKDVILPVTIKTVENDEEVKLELKVDYGLCKEICIPVSDVFSLTIGTEIDNEALSEIQKFFPKKITDENHIQFKQQSPKLTLFVAIIFAIFGGAILNVMPCVLPVLSLKLMSVLKHSELTIKEIRLAFLSTIIGILFCFVIFAFMAYAVQFTGNSFGWGLQFQNPYFLIFLILILTLFIGNLVGILEINFNQFLATILNQKISNIEKTHGIFLPNFLSGILAVLLATPCSAPFLGSAISFALVQKTSLIFLILICIGIGFSLPYVVLMITPKLVWLLPKPGKWMVKVKQFLAWLLAATILWLIYVLSHNIGNLSALLSGICAVGILGFLKIKSQFFRYLALSALVISAFSTPSGKQNDFQNGKKIGEEIIHERIWRKFDEAELYRQVMHGKTVVIDITADWCLTCKFNKIRVFQDEEVVKKLRGGDIICMRGDITKMNEEIMSFLRKHHRFAIPFNAVYGPGAKTGLLTSELLSKKELFELIEKAQENK